MRIFSVSLGRPKSEFLLEGVANVATKEVVFQAFANGALFFEDKDYNRVRSVLMHAVELNKQKIERSN